MLDFTNNIGNKKLRKGFRSTIIGIATNTILATIKISVGVIGGSFALVADGIESTMDIFSSLIVFNGLRIAIQPPDEKHPYGHGKAEPIAAGLVSIALLIASVFIFSEAVYNLFNEKSAPEVYTLYVLVIVVITKIILFKYVIKVGDEIQSIVVKSDAKHHLADMMTSGAAFIGISIALIGGKGYENADDWAAMFAGLVIFYNSINLLKPALSELMDSAPEGELENHVKSTALAVEGVVGLDKCKIRKMGFDYFVDLDIIVDGNISVRKGHVIAHKVKSKLMTEISGIANALIHVEPNDERIDGRLPLDVTEE